MAGYLDIDPDSGVGNSHGRGKVVAMTGVFIAPHFRGEDKGEGGIRRVVEAQRRWLPAYGIEVVDREEDADVFALHAGNWYNTDKPIVAHSHGLYWSGYDWLKWAIALNKDVIRTMRQADVVTAPSEWVAQAIRRGMWIDPVVLHHGIEPGEWNVGRRGGYVLWNKGRVDAVCDPDVVSKLAALAPDAKFISTFVREQLPNIETTGVVGYEDAKGLVQHASIYLATTRETFGIGTLEAMCAGVPVLGWRWGGQVEFVEHKRHGYLAEPGNIEDLLDGLRYCQEYGARLGRAARSDVLRHYTWQQRMQPYAELYKRLHEASRDRPHVSVVITNYNLGRYLPDAVASVDDKDAEIVLVDDASTEALPDEVVSNPRVKIVRNSENMYLAEALNVGVRASTGRYVVPLDADNMLASNALVVLSDELDKDRGLDIAYGKMEVINSEGRYVSGWPPEAAELGEQLRHRNQISSTAMYRRSVWERVGGYRRRCHTAEDADFWTRALAIGFTGRRVTDAVTLVYRDRRDSMSHVQKDWAWHSWYQWSADLRRRSFAAGGQYIPTHEFPIVSVVIPVGPDHQRLVLDALDSLQNQTFQHWEAIVVNDTGEDLSWIHPWARVLSTGGAKGAATARNVGLDAVRSPYVMFLDADDWLHADAVRLMYELVKEHGGFAYSDWFVGETGEIKTAPEFDPDLVLRQLPYPVTCLYKTDDLRGKGVRWDESFDGKGWEDWDFALQVIAKAGICGSRVAAPLFHYRLGSSTLRDKAYIARDTMKQTVLEKWGAYITGEEENMARGCGCGGGVPSMFQYPSQNGAEPPTGQADPNSGKAVVQLEYTSDTGGTRSFTGRMTGVRYRFGVDLDHKVRLVYEEDAQWLLSLGFFKKHTPATSTSGSFEALEAKGPPQRIPARVGKGVMHPGQALVGVP